MAELGTGHDGNREQIGALLANGPIDLRDRIGFEIAVDDQLGNEWKARNSHRALAARQLLERITDAL